MSVTDKDQQTAALSGEAAVASNNQFNDKAVTEAAHQSAEADIQQDPDYQPSGPEADLDEGELARLDN